jgi:hypothetical protein
MMFHRAVTRVERRSCLGIKVASLFGHAAQNPVDGISKNGLGEGSTMVFGILRRETHAVCLLACINFKKFL